MNRRSTCGLSLAIVATFLVAASLGSSGVSLASPGHGAQHVARTARTAAATPIIVDHTSTDITQVPEAWLTKAKSLTLHYAHTSHGSQLVTGIENLQEVAPGLGVAIKAGGAVGLPAASGALRIYDGNNPDTYITPELYWSEAAGLAKTRSVADTGLFGFSMWSWCGQQSSNSEATVQQYLATLDQLETQYPAMRFIYMTGHTDGGSATVTRNNQMVRDYVATHGKVLYDFADIESYDPAGNHYPQTTDACAWCETWCQEHPGDCQNLPGSCAHSHPFNCLLKGRAFWWLMARVAGWPGPGEAARPQLFLPRVSVDVGTH